MMHKNHTIEKDGKITVISFEPIWSYGPILPPTLIDILDKTLDEDVDSDDEDITDYEELISELDED